MAPPTMRHMPPLLSDPGTRVVNLLVVPGFAPFTPFTPVTPRPGVTDLAQDPTSITCVNLLARTVSANDLQSWRPNREKPKCKLLPAKAYLPPAKRSMKCEGDSSIRYTGAEAVKPELRRPRSDHRVTGKRDSEWSTFSDLVAIATPQKSTTCTTGNTVTNGYIACKLTPGCTATRQGAVSFSKCKQLCCDSASCKSINWSSTSCVTFTVSSSDAKNAKTWHSGTLSQQVPYTHWDMIRETKTAGPPKTDRVTILQVFASTCTHKCARPEDVPDPLRSSPTASFTYLVLPAPSPPRLSMEWMSSVLYPVNGIGKEGQSEFVALGAQPTFHVDNYNSWDNYYFVCIGLGARDLPPPVCPTNPTAGQLGGHQISICVCVGLGSLAYNLFY